MGSGCLSGLCQTAYRAELYAVAFTLHHAAQGRYKVRIYSDCLGVVNRFHLLSTGNMRLKKNMVNTDLWEWILVSLEVLGRSNVELHKTESHRPLHTARTRHEAWRFWNNEAADQIARWANLQRSSSFWSLWSEHVRQVQGAAILHEQVWKLHVEVGLMSVRGAQETSPDERPAARQRAPREFEQRFNTSAWDGMVPLAFSTEYGAGMAKRLSIWWQQRTSGQSEVAVNWISLAHLYIDYQLSWGCPGPIKHNKAWLDATQRKYLEVEKHNFLLRLKLFKRFIKLFWKQTHQEINVELCRCEGEVIQSFVNAASVKWDPACFNFAEDWLARHVKSPCARGSSALTNLPVTACFPGMALASSAPKGAFGMDYA